MQRPSTTLLIARRVLLWFLLSLGVAIASPLLNPRSIEMVCSGLGLMKLIVHSNDGSTEQVGHTLDCPLCANLCAPPLAFVPMVAAPSGLTFSALPVEIARLAARLRGPWQARAPPAFS